MRREGWYQYYAGFSPDFVRDALALVGNKSPHVLDPWVGAGTTCWVASELGHRSTGIDVNPALVVISKARLLRSDIRESLPAITEDLVRVAIDEAVDLSENEPLKAWFAPSTCAHIRSLERSIYRVLVDPQGGDTRMIDRGLHHLSGLAAFFYVALFRTVRSILKNASTSNPTWVKAAVPPKNRAKPRREAIHKLFRAAQQSLAAFLGIGYEEREAPPNVPHEIQFGSSTSLNLADETVDVVVTSPPYCTRIDYIAAVRSELAVLGCQAEEMGRLKHLTLGSPTLPPAAALSGNLPGSVKTFLTRVKDHQSKASKSYYLRYFQVYFELLDASIAELTRVVRAGGHAFIVVQDSYYKEIHLDLAQATSDLAESQGWIASGRFDFPVGRTMAIVNPKVRSYRSEFGAMETVLQLARPKAAKTGQH